MDCVDITCRQSLAPAAQERWEEPDMEYQVRSAPAASLAHHAQARNGEEDLEIDAQEVSEHRVRERHHPLLHTSIYKYLSTPACCLSMCRFWRCVARNGF